MISDEVLKILGIKDDPQSLMSNAEVMTMSILYTESLSLVKTISSTSSTACSFLARTKALAIGATVVSNALEIVLTKV